jgi:hypothetical protein
VKAREQNKNQIPAKYTNTGAETEQAVQPNIAARKVTHRLASDKPIQASYKKDVLPTIEPVPQADGSPTSRLDAPNEKIERSGRG